MDNEPQTAAVDASVEITSLPNVVPVSNVMLIPKEKKEDEQLTVIANEVINDSLNTSPLSKLDESPSPVELTGEDIALLEKEVTADSSISTIMDVCSTAALQIRQTITNTLNSRKEDETLASSCEDTLEASLKEKLANFEQTCMLTNLPKSVVSEQSIENTTTSLQNATISENQENNISESHLDKISNSEPAALRGESPNIAGSVNRHSSFGDSSDSQSSDISITNKKHVPVVNNNEKPHKKSQKNVNNKKKGEKTMDQLLKSLSYYSSTEEKLQSLCRKHAETLEENKLTEARLKQNERQIIQLAREKEQLQAEHNRMVLAKSRLESLCRELQRQNKAVKEESLLRIREEEEKRKEVASKFQTTLNEISTLMQEHSQKNLQLKEENSELAKKLKALVEHYEMWEKHMEKVVHQKDLESQLAKAQHAKTNLQLKQETEKFLKEKQSLLENMSELQKKCTQLTTNELQLRAELNDYTSKYEEFQTVLNKSNEVFATFKTDMETTSKKIKKLEKETNIWKQKWENSNKSLLDMIADKQKRDKELVSAQQRVLTLEKLCRALQAERNDLQNQVKGLAPQEAESENP